MELSDLIYWLLVPATLVLIGFITILIVTPVLRFASWASEVILRRFVWLVLLPFPQASRRVRRWIWGIFLFGMLGWTAYHLRNLPEESPPVWAVLGEIARLLGLPLLLVFFIGLVCWASSRSYVLFYHRYIKPIRLWVESLRRAVLILGQIPLLGGVIKHLRRLIDKIKVRWCRGLLILLFYLSIFTMPVKVFPILDDWLYSHLGPCLTWPFQRIPWLPEDYAAYIGHVYLYLFDWVLLVALCYAIVVNLSRFFRRNLFSSVADAIGYFMADREAEAFKFCGYFWKNEQGKFECAVCRPEQSQPSPWIPFAQQLQAETERLDKHLVKTWQGLNSRVAAVFTAPGPADEKPKEAVCIHYHRFGKCGFALAVDDKFERFDGGSSESQREYQQLVQGIGQLVNVRESLK